MLGRRKTLNLPNTKRALQRIKLMKKEIEEILNLLSTLEQKLTQLLASETTRKIKEKYTGYYFEITWVKNKAGVKYYYAYLKSKTGKPKSIYLGKASSEKRKVIELSRIFRQLEATLNIIKQLKENIAEAHEVIEKIEQLKGIES